MSETNTQSNKDSWVARFIKNRLSRMPETYRQNSVDRKLIEHAKESYEEWNEHTPPDTPRAIDIIPNALLSNSLPPDLDDSSEVYLYYIELGFPNVIAIKWILSPSRTAVYAYLDTTLSSWWGKDTRKSGGDSELENNRYYNKDKTKWVELKQLLKTDHMIAQRISSEGEEIGGARIEFVSERIWRHVLRKLKLFYMTWYKQWQIWGSPSKFALGLYILLTKAVRPKE